MSNDHSLHEIKVPVLPESVSDAVVISWYKQPGELVKRDEPVVDIETDKVVLEVPSPVTGVVEKILENDGSTVIAQQTLGFILEKSGTDAKKHKASNKENSDTTTDTDNKSTIEKIITPSAKKLIFENQLNAEHIKGTGKNNRVLKEDVLNYLNVQSESDMNSSSTPEVESTKIQKTTEPEKKPDNKLNTSSENNVFREQKRVPMTRLRARIADRLLEAQHNAAILTTFNEVNMKPVMDMRKKYKELFEKNHDIKLGLMSFFVKAVVEALKQFPAVNASIDNNEIVYHGYFDIGVAVSSPRGLVVPVLKNAEAMSMANIEKTIKGFGIKARDNQLSLDEITGGTFSITNGGIFGSMLSTPILNPPQSGILGMHNIVERPIVENGEIVIRPIMYLALSYDHRIIDGREAVQFLVAIKNYIEDPSRLLLEI